MTTTNLNSGFCIWYRINELLEKKKRGQWYLSAYEGVTTVFTQYKDPTNDDKLNRHKTLQSYTDLSYFVASMFRTTM